MRTIRMLAKDSGNVFFSQHARDRLSERGLTDVDAINVLKTGEIKGAVTPGAAAGEWKCKVTARLVGTREVGVVTITQSMTRLFVKTVEWEDP